MRGAKVTQLTDEGIQSNPRDSKLLSLDSKRLSRGSLGLVFQGRALPLQDSPEQIFSHCLRKWVETKTNSPTPQAASVPNPKCVLWGRGSSLASSNLWGGPGWRERQVKAPHFYLPGSCTLEKGLYREQRLWRRRAAV